jgi:hypothetical protein
MVFLGLYFGERPLAIRTAIGGAYPLFSRAPFGPLYNTDYFHPFAWPDLTASAPRAV